MKKTSKKAKRALTAALAGVMMMSTAAAISASADDSVLDYDSKYYETIDEKFKRISGSPIAYWASDGLFKIFEEKENRG